MILILALVPALKMKISETIKVRKNMKSIINPNQDLLIPKVNLIKNPLNPTKDFMNLIKYLLNLTKDLPIQIEITLILVIDIMNPVVDILKNLVVNILNPIENLPSFNNHIVGYQNIYISKTYLKTLGMP